MSKASELANLIGNINMGGGGVNRNLVINGAMNVAQRGTSSTGLGASAGYFTLDRWNLSLGSTAGRLTMTQDSSGPSGFANSLKLACTTADTSIAAGEQLMLQQKIEGQNLQTIKKGTSDAKPLTLSFWVKGNASATYVAGLYEADNSRYIASTFAVTTDWTQVEITYPADTTGALDDDNASSLELWIWLHAGTTYTSGTLQTSWGSGSNSIYAGGLSSSFFDSTSRTFFITGVQLEIGQNATEFEHIPYADELLRCQRYYQLIKHQDNQVVWGAYGTTSGDYWNVRLPVEMRVNPSTALYSGSYTYSNMANFNYYATASTNTTTNITAWVDYSSNGYGYVYPATGGGGTVTEIKAEI